MDTFESVLYCISLFLGMVYAMNVLCTGIKKHETDTWYSDSGETDTWYSDSGEDPHGGCASDCDSGEDPHEEPCATVGRA